MGWVFERQIGLIWGGTRPIAPVHDGKCGANARRATIVDNWQEPLGESRLKMRGIAMRKFFALLAAFAMTASQALAFDHLMRHRPGGKPLWTINIGGRNEG